MPSLEHNKDEGFHFPPISSTRTEASSSKQHTGEGHINADLLNMNIPVQVNVSVYLSFSL